MYFKIMRKLYTHSTANALQHSDHLQYICVKMFSLRSKLQIAYK